MASIVASTRGSSAGRKPTIGIIRTEASRSAQPKDWVNAPDVVVPAVALDGGPDLLGGGPPARDAVLGARAGPPGRSPGRAPPSTSASSARSAAAPRAPPRCRGRSAASARRRRRRGRRGSAGRVRSSVPELVAQPAGGVEQLAVDVELGLVPGAVADPDRARCPASPPGGAASRSVRSCSPPIAEHDLQRAVGDRACGRAGHEVEELVGLVGAGRDPQRLHGEAGVAHPGVAVVPVALAADRLGQRGGGCGDDRRRWAGR